MRASYATLYVTGLCIGKNSQIFLTPVSVRYAYEVI